MLQDLFKETDADLPITVTSKGMFESNDENAVFLMEKLQGWINFQALAANWYSDENNIVTIKITLMPEKAYLRCDEQSSDLWRPIQTSGLSALLMANENLNTHCCIVAIGNADLKEMMDDGKKVEPNLQALLVSACNYLTKSNGLKSL